MFSLSTLQDLVQKALPDARVQAADMTGGGDHLELLVVSASFEGKGLVDRHRMIYSAVGDKIGNEIHALKMKTLTPGEAKAAGL